MTIQDEFQNPVRERLTQIVIPSQLEIDSKCDWALEMMVPRTNYDQWMRQAKSYQDTQVGLHEHMMHEITHAPDVGVLSGQFPTPTPRKRKRKRKPRDWAGDKDL